MSAAASRLSRLVGLLLSLSCAGCVETGDFGRVKRSAWNDVVSSTGSLAAIARQEPVSAFPLTDDETELRDRAWRFLAPAGRRPTVDRVLAELVATRVLPAALADPDRRAYGDELLGSDARSPASRYRRFIDDLSVDTRLIAPFAATAARVLAADRMRMRMLARRPAPIPSEVADAEGRTAENRCLIAWVSVATRFRSVSYADALARLVVAAPGSEAIAAERAHGRLVAERAVLDRFGVRPLAAAACLAPEAGEELAAPPPLTAKG